MAGLVGHQVILPKGHIVVPTHADDAGKVSMHRAILFARGNQIVGICLDVLRTIFKVPATKGFFAPLAELYCMVGVLCYSLIRGHALLRGLLSALFRRVFQLLVLLVLSLVEIALISHCMQPSFFHYLITDSMIYLTI